MQATVSGNMLLNEAIALMWSSSLLSSETKIVWFWDLGLSTLSSEMYFGIGHCAVQLQGCYLV